MTLRFVLKSGLILLSEWVGLKLTSRQTWNHALDFRIWGVRGLLVKLLGLGAKDKPLRVSLLESDELLMPPNFLSNCSSKGWKLGHYINYKIMGVVPLRH